MVLKKTSVGFWRSISVDAGTCWLGFAKMHMRDVSLCQHTSVPRVVMPCMSRTNFAL